MRTILAILALIGIVATIYFLRKRAIEDDFIKSGPSHGCQTEEDRPVLDHGDDAKYFG